MAFLLSAPLAALSWAMIAASHHIWVILASRFKNVTQIQANFLGGRVLSGIIFGVFQANGKVYNAEIAHPDFRSDVLVR